MTAAVGIDLGTTNTVVATVDGTQARVLVDDAAERLIPSVVSFHPSGQVLVGRAAKERRRVDARNTIYSIKRLIGRAWDSEDVQKSRKRFPFELREGPGQGALVVARGETYTLPEISAYVLRRAKAVAEEALGTPVTRAVITVPANFNDLQRAATKVAGRVAGLEVLRILNEPTAAALAYGYGREGNERIAIFDFGGGTFDMTLLDLSGNVFEVLATAGDTFLGGDDVDAAIAERMADAFLRTHRYDVRADPQAFDRLRVAAEGLKVRLSLQPNGFADVADVAFGPGGKALGLGFSMSRHELNLLVDPLLDRAFQICEQALATARVDIASFHQVVLVGGSTKIPRVRERVASFFGREPLDTVSPDEVVALGAAIQAMAVTGATPGVAAEDLAMKGAGPARGPLATLGGLGEAAEAARARAGVGAARQRLGTDPDLRQRVATNPAVPKFNPTPPALRPRGGVVPSTMSGLGEAAERARRAQVADDESTVDDPNSWDTGLAHALVKPSGNTGRFAAIPTSTAVDTAAYPASGENAPPGASGSPPTTAAYASGALSARQPGGPAAIPRVETRGARAPEVDVSTRRGVPGRPLAPSAVLPAGTLLSAGDAAREALRRSSADDQLSSDDLEALLPLGDETSGPLFPRDSDPGRPPPSDRTRTGGSLLINDESSTTAVHDVTAIAREAGIDLAGPSPANLSGATVPLAVMPAPPRTMPMPTADRGLRSSSGAIPTPALGEASRFATHPSARPTPFGLPVDPSVTALAERAGVAPVAPAFVAPPILIDVTPLSLCVETAGGYCDVIVARNTPVPCERTRVFATVRNNQRVVRVRVAQGEAARFGDNTHLGELELAGVREGRRGEVTVSVTFAIDANGMVNVRARDVQTGNEAQARLHLVGLPTDQDPAAMRARQDAQELVH